MIKKPFLISVLMLALCCSTAFGWVQSFRQSASGNLLYGDFDNDLDAIYIWDNHGYRLYTTLSNLSNQNDQFFQDAGDGVYLLGASGGFGLPSLMGWESRSMVLFQLADARDDLNSGLDTDYDGTIDLAGTGSMSGDFTQYFDLNNDNIFDSRANYGSSSDNYDLLKKRDWHITHSYRKGDEKLGITYDHLGYGNNYSEETAYQGLFNFLVPAHNFSYSQDLVLTDLSTLEVMERRSESGDFMETYETPADIVTLSYEAPFNYVSDSELRIDLGMNKSTDQYNVDDVFSTYRNVSGGGITDINQAGESVAIDSSLGGTLFSGDVHLTKHWNPDAYSWFLVGFGLGSYDADKTQADRFDWDRQLSDAVGNVNRIIRNYDEVTDRSGDTKRKVLNLYHKTVVDFTEKFKFAAGLDFQWISDKTDWDQTYTMTDNGSFDNGDGTQNHDDSTYTRVQSRRTGLENETKRVNVNLPVAMEYVLGRWTFRLGAIHAIQRITVEENIRIKKSSPQVTTIIYGDNDTTVTVADDEFLSTRTAHETSAHATHFVYGLEFNANKHLKAELLAFLSTADTEFLNSDFYRQLKLSLTVLF
jgi:hypothetical protein